MRRLRAGIQWGVFALTVWGGGTCIASAADRVRARAAIRQAAGAGGIPADRLADVVKLWVTTRDLRPGAPRGAHALHHGDRAVAAAQEELLRLGLSGGNALGSLRDGGAAGCRARLTLRRWLDVPLRSLKYVLLGFFRWIIVVQMPAAAIRDWLLSDYWKIADLQMLGFFRHPPAPAIGVLGALAALSLVTRNFWCRYVCPYGALLGLASIGAARESDPG